MNTPTTYAAGRRIRREASEWRDIIDRFEQSGQTRDRFYAEHNLGISTFSRWRQRLQSTRSTLPAGNGKAVFVELESVPPTHPSPLWDVELQLGAGMVLRLRRTGC